MRAIQIELRATRVAAVLASCAVLLLASGPARAAETLVESFSGRQTFAPMWPGGTVDQGGDNGFSFLRLVTDGDGNGAFVSNIRPYKPALDFSDRFVKVWVRVDDFDKLGGMEFRLSSDRFATSYYAFSFAVYDDIDFNVMRDGVWTTLTFNFGQARVVGEPRRDAINSIGLYLSDKGQEEPVTTWWGGLAAVDEPAEGVVTFTFDDGYDEHFVAAEMMAKHGFRGTAYVIPEAVGEVGYMTLHQLVELQDRLGWDVAAHHKTPFTEMRPDELEDAMLGIQRFLTENRFTRGARHLAYPLGKQNTSFVRPLARKHFTTARVASAGPETLPPADPHLLRVMNVTTTTSPQAIGEAARRAREDREWLILMFHYLVDEPAYDTQYSLADFEQVLLEVEKAGVRVEPLIEVWDACGLHVAQRGCQLGPALAAPAGAR